MVFHSHTNLVKSLENQRNESTAVGFVPTMGALHDGHIALMKHALLDNDLLVVSIFVNPTQFNNSEDLAKYPRLLDQDVEKINTSFPNQNILIYSPSVDDVYGTNTISKNYDFGDLELVMEGEKRPGHFNGVGTVLEFLFDVVRPDRAYFGEKDFQQLQIIKRLVKNLNLDLEIIGCPIHREKSGLAMSSRNGRLTNANFEKAAFIYETLLKVRGYFPNHSIQETSALVDSELNSQKDFELEYFTIADEQTLIPATTKESGVNYRAFIVVHLQGVRLIDNIPLH